jgi:hypothetical protein
LSPANQAGIRAAPSHSVSITAFAAIDPQQTEAEAPDHRRKPAHPTR